MSKKLECTRLAEISTVHITAADREALLAADPELVLGVVEGGRGHLVFLPEGDDPEEVFPQMSSEFQECMRVAAKQNFEYVRFDCDGPEYEFLPLCGGAEEGEDEDAVLT